MASVLAALRTMSARGPGRVIPYSISVTASCLLAHWLISSIAPKGPASVCFVLFACFGSVLLSGFWSIISELFDLGSAKAKVGRIAAGGTVGGILGGLIAERTGAMLSVAAMLLVVALLHAACAVLTFQLRNPKTIIANQPDKPGSSQALSGFKVLQAAPYLKNLAWLILLGSVAETLLDYVLKTQATATYGRGDQLIRFFGFF